LGCPCSSLQNNYSKIQRERISWNNLPKEYIHTHTWSWIQTQVLGLRGCLAGQARGQERKTSVGLGADVEWRNFFCSWFALGNAGFCQRWWRSGGGGSLRRWRFDASCVQLHTLSYYIIGWGDILQYRRNTGLVYAIAMKYIILTFCRWLLYPWVQVRYSRLLS
jgi:hypothetical protein